MIFINIFQSPPPLVTIGIIIEENVYNYGRPITKQMLKNSAKYCSEGCYGKLLEQIFLYSLHQKKVYTCDQEEYSKCRKARIISRGVPGFLGSWSNSSQVGFRNSDRWRHREKKSNSKSVFNYRKMKKFPLTSMQLV